MKLKPWPRVPFRLMALAYIIWLSCDLVLWANEKIENVLFFWTILNLVEPLIFVGSYAFFSKFVHDRPLIKKERWVIFGLLLPTLVMAPIGLSVVGFDYTTCDRNAVEGIAAYYNYFLEAAFIAAILVSTVINLKKERFKERRSKLLVMSGGMVLLLFSFLAANFFGTLFDEYTISQYGHIAVPIFAAFLAYITIKYEAFEPRLLFIDTLVAGLLVLLASLFFVRNESYQTYVNTITFLIAIPLSYSLVRGIRRENKARREIENLAKQLQTVNTNLATANTRLRELDTQKTEFISFATHQLRSPLTAIKGHTSLILEGDLGPISPGVKDALETIYASVKTQVNIVEDYLNVSRIELGTMKYNMVNMDFKNIVEDVVNEQKTNVEAKGLKLSVVIDRSQPFPIKADPDKFKQVLMNLIDNSIKYTPSGLISVELIRNPGNKTFRLKIADTGTGIRPDVIPKLFQKFSRAPNASAANIHGTGLGLFLAKEIMNAHKGRIWAESEGEGKGSQFYVELPEAK